MTLALSNLESLLCVDPGIGSRQWSHQKRVVRARRLAVATNHEHRLCLEDNDRSDFAGASERKVNRPGFSRHS